MTAPGHSARITVKPSWDLTYFDTLVRKPAIYAKLGDDTSPPREEFSVASLLKAKTNYFLGVFNGDQAVGFFAFIAGGDGQYEVHTVLDEQSRGVIALEAGKKAWAWMFTFTDCVRLISLCPDFCKEGLVFARKTGFKTDFRREDFLRKGGKSCGAAFVSYDRSDWRRVNHHHEQQQGN